jgi:hypothetical protein
MNRWPLVFTAILLAGCVGKIGDPPSQSSGSGGGSGSNGNGSGNGGSSNGSGNGGSSNGSGNGGSSNGSGNGGSQGTGGYPTGAGGGGSTPTVCTPGVPVTSQIARLTNAQYDQTIADLLGVTSLDAANGVAPSTILPTDQLGSITSLAWSSYQSVANMIATQVMASSTLKGNFLKCTFSGDGSACLKDTINKFGRRAFRRPLTTDEVTSFTKIITNGAKITATGTPTDVAGTLLYMFLISPSFLQREETNGATADSNGNYPLSSYEVASRLSYLLWNSMPDDTLATAADNNQLQTSAQILSQAQRMLMSTRARAKVNAFHQYYLLMGTNTRWDTIIHDSSIFPAFSSSMVGTLENETQMFFDNIVFGSKPGTFQDLLLSNTAYVNNQIAPLYNLDPSKFTSDLSLTTLDSSRPGFLTRVGFLNAYSSYSRTSPILRGAFITKQIMGTQIGSPPPGATNVALPTGADLDTNRKQVDAQTADGQCAGCHHVYINPPGFVMEAFNAVGTPQTTEATTGAPIDTTADVMIDGNTVHCNNPSDLMNALAVSPMTQARYAERWTSFAYERESDPMDCGTVNTLSTKIAAGGYTIQNLITDLTQTTSFRTRAVGATQ